MDSTKYTIEWFIKRIVIALVILIVLAGSFVTVATGELGVKTRLGKVVGVVEPGFHLKKPFVEQVEKINVRTQVVKNEHYINTEGEVVSNNPLEAASNDLQDVRVSVVVNYAIDQTKIIEIYTSFKTAERFEEGVIKPLIKQIVKTETANYTANDLVTKRAELNSSVTEKLRTAIAEKYGVFEQSNITNIEFSESFTLAIEKKVTAEQDALAAKNKLEQAKYEKEATIVKAQGESESIRIQSQAINSQGGADYVQLKAIEKWQGYTPTYMMGNSVPFINLNNK